MKTVALTALAIAFTIVSSGSSSAQDVFEQSLQMLRAQDAQYEQQLSNWMEQGRQQEAAYERQLRQATGDYRTPAHILFQRHNQQLRAQNPAWAAQMDRRLSNNQRNFNAQNQAMQGAFNEVNRMSMNGYNNRSAMQYRGHQNSINNINERQFYVNPQTGQRYNLNYNSGFQTDGNNMFYRGSNGPMYRFDSSGFGDELDEDF